MSVTQVNTMTMGLTISGKMTDGRIYWISRGVQHSRLYKVPRYTRSPIQAIWRDDLKAAVRQSKWEAYNSGTDAIEDWRLPARTGGLIPYTAGAWEERHNIAKDWAQGVGVGGFSLPLIFVTGDDGNWGLEIDPYVYNSEIEYPSELPPGVECTVVFVELPGFSRFQVVCPSVPQAGVFKSAKQQTEAPWGRPFKCYYGDMLAGAQPQPI